MEYTIKIEQDISPLNPREDFDQYATMVCFHSRYNLGDKHDYSDPEHFVVSIWDEFATDKEKRDFILKTCKSRISRYRNILSHGYNDVQSLFEYCVDWYEVPDYFPENIFILPLYLYDHSGITINTTGFTCQWDSGQVGYIYMEKEKALKEFPKLERVTEEKWNESIYKHIKMEVEEYNHFLTGDIWGYIIEDEKGDHIDSCWGLYGREYCEQEANNALEYYKKTNPQQLNLNI